MWVAMLALEVLLTLAFASMQRMQDIAEREFIRLREVVGSTHAERIAIAATAAGASLFGMSRHGDSDAEAWQPTRRGLDVVRERARALLLVAFLRAASWRDMATALLACAVAAAVDGLMVRRRRAFTFEPTSSALYNAAAHLLIAASMAPLACVVAPVTIPAITVAALGLVLVASVWILCAHLPGPATLIAEYPRD